MVGGFCCCSCSTCDRLDRRLSASSENLHKAAVVSFPALRLVNCIYMFIFLFRSVLSHRSRQVWAESLRPSTPGAVPVQAQARQQTKQQKLIPAASPNKATTVPHFMHTHTHLLQSISRFGAPRTPPQAPIYMIIYKCKHTAEFCRTRGRVLKNYI